MYTILALSNNRIIQVLVNATFFETICLIMLLLI